MNVSLKYLGENQFKAYTTKTNYLLDINKITPIEYFATSTIACTGIDLVILAEENGYSISDYEVSAQTIRSISTPMKFESFHITYIVNANFDKYEAKKFILASLSKYSTTINSIRKTVVIQYSIVLNGIKILNKQFI